MAHTVNINEAVPSYAELHDNRANEGRDHSSQPHRERPLDPLPSVSSSHPDAGKDGTREASSEAMWNILPSYHMYTASVQGNVKVLEEEAEADPPSYAYSARPSVSSIASSVVNEPSSTRGTSIIPHSTTDSASSFNYSSDAILADESQGALEETILDNAHKLKNLTHTDNAMSNSLDIQVHFTEEVCKKGVRPKHIDPSIYEYREGDHLNGYVTIKNTGSQPIPFEMLYLTFEGKITLRNLTSQSNLAPVVFSKFLEMFDFSASWSDTRINRLVHESYDFNEDDRFDPLDNSVCCFALDKTMYPGLVYKRFFTFRIPNNLLDSECNIHSLQQHVEVPPTLGDSYFKPLFSDEKSVRDLSVVGTAVSYGVLTRFVGKKSTYKVGSKCFADSKPVLVNSKGDEYVILKEEFGQTRVVQSSKPFADSRSAESKIYYNNILNRVKEKIASGSKLLKLIQSNQKCSASELSSYLEQEENEFAKKNQTYTPRRISDCKIPCTNTKYEVFSLLTKRTFSGTHKAKATINMSSPKIRYNIDYIPPSQFRIDKVTEKQDTTWKLDIPLEINCVLPDTTEKGTRAPVEIKRISAEFVSTTIRSDKFPIPLDLDHEIIHNRNMENQSFFDEDTLVYNVIKPMKTYSQELRRLFGELGPENFCVEKQLLQDVTSLGNLQEKSTSFHIKDYKIEDTEFFLPGTDKRKTVLNWSSSNDGRNFSKKINLSLNLSTMELKDAFGNENREEKAYDNFCFVPDFQSCYLGRWYSIRIRVLLSNHKYVYLRVPVSVIKR